MSNTLNEEQKQAITHTGTPLLVSAGPGSGKTTYIMTAFESKTKHIKDGKWNKFSVYVIEKVRYLKDMETLILRISKPKGNSVKGRLPKQYRLNKILEKEISMQNKKLTELKRALRPGLFSPKARKKIR